MSLKPLVLTLLLAAGIASAADTVRFGNRIIGVGDNVGLLLQVAGKPDRTVRLENRYGGAVAERWEYYLEGKAILFTVSNGRIESVEEIR